LALAVNLQLQFSTKYRQSILNWEIMLRSPRRQALIKGLGVTVTPAPAYHVCEVFPSAMPKDEVPVFLACAATSPVIPSAVEGTPTLPRI
jgi:hypothetical protein